MTNKLSWTKTNFLRRFVIGYVYIVSPFGTHTKYLAQYQRYHSGWIISCEMTFNIEPWSERRDVSRHNLGIFISVDEPSLNTKVIIIIEISTEQWWKKKLRTVYSMLILLNHLLQSVEYFWYPSKAIKTFQNTSLFYICLHCLYY